MGGCSNLLPRHYARLGTSWQNALQCRHHRPRAVSEPVRFGIQGERRVGEREDGEEREVERGEEGGRWAFRDTDGWIDGWRDKGVRMSPRPCICKAQWRFLPPKHAIRSSKSDLYRPRENQPNTPIPSASIETDRNGASGNTFHSPGLRRCCRRTCTRPKHVLHPQRL